MVVTADGIGCEASPAVAGQGALRDVSGTVPDGAAAAAAIRVLCTTAAAVRRQFSRSFRAVRSSVAVSPRISFVTDSRGTFRPSFTRPTGAVFYGRRRFHSSLLRGSFFRVHSSLLPFQTFDAFFFSSFKNNFYFFVF